jgi:hypothetical protein
MSETKVTSISNARASGEPRDRRGRAMHDLRISLMERCN